MSGLNRANQANTNGNGNGQRRLARSSSLPSTASSPSSNETSEHRSPSNNTGARETASSGPQIRTSRSFESTDMSESPQTPFSTANNNNNQVTIANAANEDAYNGHPNAQFQIGHNGNEDDVFGSSHRQASMPVTGTAVAMRCLDPAATARLDAQGIYPSTACVFVANLPEPKDDLALEAAVTRAFSRFGTVFVKIRRDATHMPFAFAQYTSEEDARRAEVEGRNAMILGRPCRTEMVRANRTYVVYRNDRQPLEIQQAGDILMPYGRFSKIERLDDGLAAAHGLQNAVLIEFSQFERTRNLAADIRMNLVGNSRDYRVEVFDPRRSASSRANRDEDFLRRYDQDRRSVFVSNLPADTTQNQLRAFFERIGTINKIDVVMRHHPQTGVLIRVFGFIEFADTRSAPEAIATLNDANFLGYQIKVQRKITKGATDTPPRDNHSTAMRTPTGQLPDTPVRAHGHREPTSGHRRQGSTDMNQYTNAQAHHSAQRHPHNFSGGPAPGFGMANAGQHMAPAPPHGHVAGYNIPPGATNHQTHFNSHASSASPTAPPHNPAMAGGWGVPPGMVPYVDPITGICGWAFPPTLMSGMPGAPGTSHMPVNHSTSGAMMDLPHRPIQRGAPSSRRGVNSRRSSSSGSSDSGSPKQRGARLN